MISKNYYYYFHIDNLDMIEIIKSICEQKQKQQAELLDGKVNKKTRDCLISWIKDDTIYNIINEFFITANKNAGWNFDTSWNETMQYTVYNEKQFYSWHTAINDYAII